MNSNIPAKPQVSPTGQTAQQPAVQQTAQPTQGAQQDGKDNSTPVQGKSTKKILLVEDDPILARMYKEKFKNEGFVVELASDGEAGLKTALEGNVDLLLLDIMLPRLSGTDLLAKLRQDPRGKNMAVVALTNLAEESEKQKVLDLGVKDYLVKAMQTPEKVVEIVKKYIF